MILRTRDLGNYETLRRHDSKYGRLRDRLVEYLREHPDQRLASQAQVRGHVAQEARERADAEGRMTWDGDVMLTAFKGRQAKMAPVTR